MHKSCVVLNYQPTNEVLKFYRLLNIFSHVIEETVPGPPQIKPTLPSLPNAPSLSPIKRKSKVQNSPGGTTNTPEKSTPQKQQKGGLNMLTVNYVVFKVLLDQSFRIYYNYCCLHTYLHTVHHTFSCMDQLLFF